VGASREQPRRCRRHLTGCALFHVKGLLLQGSGPFHFVGEGTSATAAHLTASKRTARCFSPLDFSPRCKARGRPSPRPRAAPFPLGDTAWTIGPGRTRGRFYFTTYFTATEGRSPNMLIPRLTGPNVVNPSLLKTGKEADGITYKTDTWDQDTQTGDRFEGAPNTYVHFEGQNPAFLRRTCAR